jgi:hypothetical protein
MMHVLRICNLAGVFPGAWKKRVASWMLSTLGDPVRVTPCKASNLMHFATPQSYRLCTAIPKREISGIGSGTSSRFNTPICLELPIWRLYSWRRVVML